MSFLVYISIIYFYYPHLACFEVSKYYLFFYDQIEIDVCRMVFELLGSKKRSKINERGASYYQYQVRHENTTSKGLNSYLYNLISPWIAKPASTSSRVKSQADYVTIAPRHHKEVKPVDTRWSDARTVNPSIHVIAPRSDVISPRSQDQGVPNVHRRRSLSRASQHNADDKLEARRSRHGRESQSRDRDCQTISSMETRRSSQSRSSTRSRSNRSSSRRRSVVPDDGQDFRNEQANDTIPQRRHSRGRSTSYTATYRIERRATRTPSPVPELDSRSIDSPVSTRSNGPETPLADRGAQRYSVHQKIGHNRVQDKDYFSPRRNDYHQEPIVYDELQHSPEDFYNPMFSPSQGFWSDKDSRAKSFEGRAAIPKLSVNTTIPNRPVPSRDASPRSKITSPAPAFNLPVVSPHRDNISSPRSVSQSKAQPTHHNKNSPTLQSPSRSISQPTTQPLANKNNNPTSPRSLPRSLETYLPQHPPLPTTTTSSPPPNKPLPPIPLQPHKNSTPSLPSSISYERLRPTPTPSVSSTQTSTSTSTSTSTHRRIRSDTSSPTRRTNTGMSIRDITSPTRQSQGRSLSSHHRSRTVDVTPPPPPPATATAPGTTTAALSADIAADQGGRGVNFRVEGSRVLGGGYSVRFGVGVEVGREGGREG